MVSITARSIASLSYLCIVNLSLNLDRVTAQSHRQQSADRSTVRGSRSIQPSNYQQLAADRLKKYLADYPGVKVYPLQLLSIDRPPSMPCSPGKQPGYILLFVLMGKIYDDSTVGILGDETKISEASIFGNVNTLKQPELAKIVTITTDRIITADKNRPALDLNSQVLYQYRLQFNPVICQK